MLGVIMTWLLFSFGHKEIGFCVKLTNYDGWLYIWNELKYRTYNELVKRNSKKA